MSEILTIDTAAGVQQIEKVEPLQIVVCTFETTGFALTVTVTVNVFAVSTVTT